MKNKNYSPYGTYNPNKIESPKSTNKSEPKTSKIVSTQDLRGGRSK